MPHPQVEWLVIVAGRAIVAVSVTQTNCHALGATASDIIVFMIFLPLSWLVLAPKCV